MSSCPPIKLTVRNPIIIITHVFSKCRQNLTWPVGLKCFQLVRQYPNDGGKKGIETRELCVESIYKLWSEANCLHRRKSFTLRGMVYTPSPIIGFNYEKFQEVYCLYFGPWFLNIWSVLSLNDEISLKSPPHITWELCSSSVTLSTHFKLMGNTDT